MKVAVLIDTWFPAVGGGQTNAYEISKRIAFSGCDVDLITRDCGTENLKYPKRLNVIKLGKGEDPDSYVSKLLFLISSFLLLLKNNYDLVHAHAFLPGITARLVMVTKGTPAVFTVHGTSLKTKLLNHTSRFIEYFILTKIKYTAQITVSRDFLYMKNINTNVFYIPNGSRYKKYFKTYPKKEKPLLLFVGRLHKQKNLENLIKSINTVSKIVPKVVLQIAGSGPEGKKLKDLIKSEKLTKNVKMLGELSGGKLAKLYKSSTLLVLPSIYEGQPLVMLDAMSQKLPVVAAKTGDIPHMIKNGVSGFLIQNQFSYESIATTILKALKSKNLDKITQKAGANLEKYYNWQKSAQKTLAIYEKVTRA